MASGREFKSAVYEQFGRVGKAFASPRRLEILDLLCQSPHTVEALARAMDQSLANTSQHLQVLRGARLVEAQRLGVHVEYRLADAMVCEFFRTLRVLAESRLAEVAQVTRQFLEERDALESVDREALLARVRRGEVTVLDVRPEEEYRAGHIPGALSVPLDQLRRRLAELSGDEEIVAYCRGPYCVLALDAVKLLREQGFKATRLEDGVPDWRAHGYPVAVGEEAQ